MFLEHSLIVLLALLSLVMFWTKSPFMSLMYAVMAFINSSVVLFMLGFEFLAIVNLIIYVGALAVLFLFVIMLLEIPSAELRAYYRGYSVLALAGFIISASITNRLFLSNSPIYGGFVGQYSFIPTLESISSIGYAFYIRYADLLILNSLVLTIALFGALVLAHLRSV
jgi:NADH:ubiquinone oxidoreductase subunit 6 (subunit J)